MDIWNIDKLILFIMFVIPGFLVLKTNSLLSLECAADSSKQVIDAVAYSCINYALLSWPIFMVESSSLRASNLPVYFAFYATVLLISPILLVLIWRGLRTTQSFQRWLQHPVGKPWDYVFGQRQRYWMIVTFKDGKQVGGHYDDRSFSSSSPNLEQLYLEEAWIVNADGGLERPREESAGILVLGSEVRTIEFFNILEEERGKASSANGSEQKGLAAVTSQPTDSSSPS